MDSRTFREHLGSEIKGKADVGRQIIVGINYELELRIVCMVSNRF